MLKLAPIPSPCPRCAGEGNVVGVVRERTLAVLKLAPIPSPCPRCAGEGNVVGVVRERTLAVLKLAPILCNRIHSKQIRPGTWVTLLMSSEALDCADSFIYHAQRHVAEPQLPAPLVDLSQTDGFANKRFGDEHELTVPFDTTIGAHASHFDSGVVFGCSHVLGIGTRRRPITPYGRHASERVVRSLFIVMVTEPIEIALLRGETVPRRLEMVFQGAVHAFMAAVLVGPTGRNALERDSQLEQPNRQASKPT